MSVAEENMKRQRYALEEIANKGNLDLIPEYFSPEYTYRAFGMVINGPENFRQNLEGMLKGVPDAHYTVEDMFAAGDKVCSRVTLTATMTGEWLGYAPTGKKISVESILITRWKDGKEVEAWEQMDTYDFYRQIGIMPAE